MHNPQPNIPQSENFMGRFTTFFAIIASSFANRIEKQYHRQIRDGIKNAVIKRHV